MLLFPLGKAVIRLMGSSMVFYITWGRLLLYWLLCYYVGKKLVRNNLSHKLGLRTV